MKKTKKEMEEVAQRGTKVLLKIIEELIVAVQTGECPDPKCPTCKTKWDAVSRGKAVLELMKEMR